tara:strand:- start:496 stop:636 length:141 start_codon:yes stop_codon:yes gene_type:complete
LNNVIKLKICGSLPSADGSPDGRDDQAGRLIQEVAPSGWITTDAGF